MNRRSAWSLFVLGLGLVPLLGCESLPRGVVDLPAVSPAPEPPAKAQVELPPDQAADACLVHAKALEKSGHEADAIVQYEKARQLNPRLTQVSRRLAVLYDRQCDYSKAQAEYKLALAANPRDPGLLNDLGYHFYERGDWMQAEKWLLRALEADPSYQRAWVNLGLVLGQQERYEESYDAFTKVVNPAEARGNVGVILARQGKHGEAKEALRQALALEPDLKPARVVLAKLESPEPAAPDVSLVGHPPVDEAVKESDK
jgi:Tfp pilus assembly protein PilF